MEAARALGGGDCQVVRGLVSMGLLQVMEIQDFNGCHSQSMYLAGRCSFEVAMPSFLVCFCLHFESQPSA